MQRIARIARVALARMQLPYRTRFVSGTNASSRYHSARRIPCLRPVRLRKWSVGRFRIEAHSRYILTPDTGPAGDRLTEAEVRGLRMDTPGCHGTVHLNNAGCALPPRQVLDATLRYLQQEAMTGEKTRHPFETKSATPSATYHQHLPPLIHTLFFLGPPNLPLHHRGRVRPQKYTPNPHRVSYCAPFG
eukprot:1180916-Prorocentrum_minimum.AAC.2